MIVLAAFLVAAQEVEHDPRTHPTFLRHALCTIEGVAGPVVTIGDLDGDEVSEILARKGRQLTVYEGGTGEELRPYAEVYTWDVGDDVDQDGVRDLAVKPRDKGPKRLEVRSGRTGEVLYVHESEKGPPTCFAWVGDVDGDGLRDLAYGDRGRRDVVVLSAATWGEIWRQAVGEEDARVERIESRGDRTGDGVEDLSVVMRVVTKGEPAPRRNAWISGSDGAPLDEPVEFQAGHRIGDIDGDGVEDIARGNTLFVHHPDDTAEAFAGLTLGEAIARGNFGGPKFWETAGSVWVASGATGEPIMGVWGEPGSIGSVGREVYGIDDMDFDGWRDLAVYSEAGLHVFSTGRPEVRSDDPFDWLPGRWVARETRRGEVVVSEETWLEPAGGRMLGVTRSFVEGSDRGGSFEFLRIEREGARLVLLAQPGGKPPTRFDEAERGRAHVLFTNPDHDFPTRILYRRTRDELFAEVGTDADPAALRLRWALFPGR